MSCNSKEQAPLAQQQQQVQAPPSHSTTSLDEECLSAQRAAIEAIHVGRATVEQAQLQQEQLSRAETLADETQYKLDKAGRVLRGMESWGGWIANKFTKDVAAPISSSINSHKSMMMMAGNVHSNDTIKHNPHSGDGPKIYENLPEACQPAAQAIQNYHVNVQVLEQCLDEEQKETCGIICHDMYRIASLQLENLKSSHDDAKTIEAYWIPLEQDLEHLRKRQVESLTRIRFNNNNTVESSSLSAVTSSSFTSPTAAKTVNESKSISSPSKSSMSNNRKDNGINLHEDADIRLQQQDEHLNVLGQALGELSHIAKSLNQSIEQQNEIVDSQVRQYARQGATRDASRRSLDSKQIVESSSGTHIFALRNDSSRHNGQVSGSRPRRLVFVASSQTVLYLWRVDNESTRITHCWFEKQEF
jgi:hypothetical protein